MSSIKSKLVVLSVLFGLILYAGTATASYLLSVHKVNEERAKQVAGIQDQVSRNLAIVFGQVEKIALVLSKNQELLQDVSRRGDDLEAELARVQTIETGLFKLNTAFYPIIESIMLSDGAGKVYVSANPYFLTAEDWNSLHYSRVPQLQDALAGKQEAWVKPMPIPAAMPGARASNFAIVFQDRYAYIKTLPDRAAIVITVNYRKIEDTIRNDSVYSYELSPSDERQQAIDNGEKTASLLERVGLDVRVQLRDAGIGQIARSNRESLLYTVAALSLGTMLAAVLFAPALVRPVERLKRQIEDLKKLETAGEVLRYKARRIRPLSFRIKIFAFLVTVCLCGIAALFSLNYGYASQMIKHSLEKYYAEYVFQSGKWIEANLQSSEKVLNTIMTDENLQRFFTTTDDKIRVWDEFKLFFSYQHVFTPNINYINLYDSKGKILYSTISSYLNEGPIQLRNVYPTLEQSRGETVYFNDDKDPFGDHVITAAKKIFAPGDNRVLLGYYLFAVNERELELLNNSLGLVPLHFLITEQNGTVIYSKNTGQIGQDWMNVAEIARMDKGYFSKTIDGREQIVLIDEMNRTNWKFVSFVDAADTFQGARDILLVNGFLLLAVLLLVFVVTFWLSNRIARPMKELIGHLRIVIDNKFEQTQPVPTFAEKDEIGELAAHIRAMIRKIQEQMNYIYDVEVKNREIQLEYKKAELSNLLQQINPHFLYNTLETVRWMSMQLTNGENKVTRTIRALSMYLRSGIHPGTRIVPLKEELAHVRSYLYIQQIRFDDKLAVKWSLDPAADEVKTVKFLLQPVVENALIHGLEGKEAQARLLIRVRKEENKLVIEVVDNGMGIEPRKLEQIRAAMTAEDGTVGAATAGGTPSEQDIDGGGSQRGGTGIGLGNIGRRLSLMYGGRAGIRIESEPNRWTKVTIELPLEPDGAQREAGPTSA